MLLMLKTIIAKILKKARLSSVRESTVHPSAKIEAGSSFYHSSIGKYSFCGYDCEIYHADIGNFSSIANRVVIGGARHPMEWVGMSPVFYKGRDSVRKKFAEHLLDPAIVASIGHDVWIGHSAVILSGVQIGNGAVVGAGAVVTKNVPPYGIVAGNPARLIRYRFDEATISALMKIDWWEFDDEKISNLVQYIRDPAGFIYACQDIISQ